MSLEANLRGVHPILAHRIRLLLALPELSKYGTYPAVRDRAKQERFFAAYKAGKGPLAADPNRTLRTGSAFPYDWTPKGSWHMVQGDGYGHAVDLKRPWNRSRAQARAEVHPHLARMGLRATVRSEWWHVQALTSQGWGDGPMPDGSDPLPTPEPQNVLAEIAKFIAACRKEIVKQGQSGVVVKFLQSQLANKGETITADGSFGPKTAAIVRSFQSANGLTADGIVGPATWSALLD